MPASEKVVRNVRRMIDSHGFAVMGIGTGVCHDCGDGKPHVHGQGLSFHYTVGLLESKLPELLLFGLSALDGHQLLTILAGKMKKDGVFTHGAYVSLGGTYPLLAIEADDPETFTEYVTMPKRVYRRNIYPVIEMLTCDRQGRYPPDCDKPYSDTPILSSRYPVGGH